MISSSSSAINQNSKASDASQARSNQSESTKAYAEPNSKTVTPLSNFARKFNLWKKKKRAHTASSIKTSSSFPGKLNESSKKASMSEAMYKSIGTRTTRKMENRRRPVSGRRPNSTKIHERSIPLGERQNQKRSVDFSQSQQSVVDGMSKMQMVEGMNKIRPSSRDDYTEVTSSSTQSSMYSVKPTFSLSGDDGSTIASEITTDSSYAFHTFEVDKHKFTVDKRYSMIRSIGSGAYGVVISAKDFASGTNVAIKMIPKAFHDEIDAKRILREIKLLKHFHHTNIISIQDMMPPLARHVRDFRDVYIVTDLMETDLHRIIYSKQSLSLDHVQYFLYQIMRAVKYMHSANVLHRDLKPSNLLVNSNCDLKVCDFGLARGISPTHDQDLENDRRSSLLLTEYVVTRWYRAPEIMLACHEYSKPIDVWSAGCIFAELLGRKPYLAGDDYIDQVGTCHHWYINNAPFSYLISISHYISATAHSHHREIRKAI